MRRLAGLVTYETASTARSARGTGHTASPFTKAEIDAMIQANVAPASAHSLSSARLGISRTMAAAGLAKPRTIRRCCG
jgi:hypothetical protein